MQDVGILAAIGILGAVFVIALVSLLVVVKRRYCKPPDLISRQYLDVATVNKVSSPDLDLIRNGEGLMENPTGVELDDVGFNADLEQMLQNETWAHDAAGLVPHCLAILKTAHLLTERLVSVTLSHAEQLQIPETLSDLVAVAKRIGCRVDDVVRAMYPPLDPRLLEARCSALHLSVSHLVMVAKTTSSAWRGLDWVDQSLADVEDHLKALREASIEYESSLNCAGCSAAGATVFVGPASASNDPWGEQNPGSGNTDGQPDVQISSFRESSQV